MKKYKLYCKPIKDRVGKEGWCYIKIYRKNIINVFISYESPSVFLFSRQYFVENTEIFICETHDQFFNILLV